MVNIAASPINVPIFTVFPSWELPWALWSHAQQAKIIYWHLDIHHWAFFKTHEIETTLSAMFKRHYIDKIEYPLLLIFGGKPQFESNHFNSAKTPLHFGAFWWGKIFFSVKGILKKSQYVYSCKFLTTLVLWMNFD